MSSARVPAEDELQAVLDQLEAVPGRVHQLGGQGEREENGELEPHREALRSFDLRTFFTTRAARSRARTSKASAHANSVARMASPTMITRMPGPGSTSSSTPNA